MSEIPFVKQLGDAVEAAIAAPERSRGRRPRRRRRVAVLAFAVFALGATGTTIAALVGGQDERALGSISCYRSPDLEGEVDQVVADGKSPTAACAAHRSDRGLAVTPLVACRPNGDGVAVVPGRGAGACRELGLRALPAALTAAQPKVERLASDIAAIEGSAECIPPRELRDRSQALLDRPGWEGWRATIEQGDGGPCGWVRRSGGLSEPSLRTALRSDLGELRVAKGPPRSLHRWLFGDGSLSASLVADTGRRCFTVSELRAHARRELAVTGRAIGFHSLGALPPNSGVTPASRQARYEQGCAIAAGASPVYPRPGEVAVEVEYYLEDG
jgi:hypothetical protein